MKTTILSELRNREGYVSGQELCDRLGVSRTAVWKVIRQLKEEGYVIEAQTNKGYRLLSGPDTLEAYEVAGRLHTRWAGHEIHTSQKTGSTNADAKALAESGSPHGTLVLTEVQTNGRGRRGHVWQSMEGTAISMSMICRPEFPPEKASMLTLVMGLAVSDAICSMTGLGAMIKWPNDIVIQNRKVAGILTEMSAEPDYIQYVIIGAGINVNTEQADFPEEIKETAGSLKSVSGRSFSRAQLIEEILRYFEKYYEIFDRTLDLSGMMGHYNERLVSREKQVKILNPKTTFEGISTGIDQEGNLLVKKTDGNIAKVSTGEVSVRGLLGYL
jgi:BirA family biotin operon repressor/biotin-[acetyl-CoA-carboxylase] ligase